MPAWLTSILISAGSVVLTLTTTLIFNKIVGVPKEIKKQKELERQKEEQQIHDNKTRDQKIATLEVAIASLPGYRAQSLQIQQQLQSADTAILATCQQIQTTTAENQRILNNRLDRLEKREKNALREKILDEYRLMTSKHLNPAQAWSEMEHHAFFELVKDYEELGGNDYVHSEVIPAVNLLLVIPMTDLEALKDLYDKRAAHKFK
jgi:hypothetical protein